MRQLVLLFAIISSVAFADSQVIYNMTDSKLTRSEQDFVVQAMKERCPLAFSKGYVEYVGTTVLKDEEYDQGKSEVTYKVELAVEYPSRNFERGDEVIVYFSNDYTYNPFFLSEIESSSQYECDYAAL